MIDSVLLFVVLSFSAFFRLFRLHQLLGFWYDQGRDALVIWDLIHYKNFFLIGPVTGIEGIFLGPFYYYLIAPFYWLSGGDPVFVAAFLGWLSVGTIFLIYWLAKEIYGRQVGLVAAFLYGFSYDLITFSRWLANPNPLPFFTLLALIFLWKSIQKNENYLIPAVFLIGLCLQLEAASAIFFLPTTLAIIVWQFKKLGKPRIMFFSFLAFFVTLLPQIIFNFRHQGILLTAFKRFLVAERSFRLPFFEVLKDRVVLYYNVTFGKLFSYHQEINLISVGLFFLSLIFCGREILNSGGKLLGIWILLPLIGFLFYRGNYGYIWGYYFSGIIPCFYIFLAASLVYLSEKIKIGRIFLALFVITFFVINFGLLKSFYQTGVGITLTAELKAIDWIYKDAGNSDFNVDIYVPPVINYSYSYLFRWYGRRKYGREPQPRQVENLYTLSELDPEHPSLLDTWLKRQDGIGKIIKTYSRGYITVQKRERIKYEE